MKVLGGYFDNAATTELCDAAKQAMTGAMGCFGNPSSLHKLGLESMQLLETARQTVADQLKCEKREIYFTSGGTEADNIAIFGAAQRGRRMGNKIVTTAIEHAAVLEPMRELEKQGFAVVYLKPDKNGNIDLCAFEDAIDENTILVSAMSVNNETGAMLPVEQLKNVIRRKNAPALLHCDCTQSFLKYPVLPHRSGMDLVTVSAHKIHGPKGVGALFVSKDARILPHTFGGGQESGLRSGTEPLLLIAGFGAAVGAAGDPKENLKKVLAVKTYLCDRFAADPEILINSPENGSAYHLNISVPGIRSETMLHFLEDKGVYVSSGSACSKGKQSHVLQAMGLDRRRIDSALRISLSAYNTKEDADMLLAGIAAAQNSLIRSK